MVIYWTLTQMDLNRDHVGETSLLLTRVEEGTLDR